MNKVFLGWDRPVSVLSAEKLFTYDKKSTLSAIDLSHILIIVPTKQSGRLLENELLKIAEKENCVLFPPEFKTPLNLLELPKNSPDAVNELTSMMEALTRCSDLSTLFPKGTPQKDGGRYEAAKTICTLRSTLAERGLLIADVTENSFIMENEPQRWHDLCSLENVYREVLNERGFIDRTDALKSASVNPVSVNFKKVIVVSVPDPLPLAINAVKIIDESIPVEIWINAPESEKNSFDSFGIPKENSFNLLPDLPDKNITIVKKPSDASEKTISILAEKDNLSVDDIGLALFTEELINPFIDSFEERGYSTYDPAGESCGKGVLFNLVKSFLQLLVENDYETFSTICRNPHFTESLEGIKRGEFLAYLDKFHDEILPIDSNRFYSEIIKVSEKSEYLYLKNAVLKFPKSLIQIISNKDIDNNIEQLLNFLTEIYSKPKSFINKEQEESFELKAKKISSLIQEFKNIISTLNVSSNEATRLLLSNIEKSAVYAPHSADSIPLQGWLEMNWSPAGNIILTGFNEGFIPESITSDLILPESARRALQLKNNAQRMTRDLFLMRTLIESRKENLHIIVLKTNSQGDPLKPSRILFSCEKDKLINRALYLFGEDSPQTAEVAIVSERSEKPLLCPALPDKTLNRISVTAFKNYLSCPFRFFLEKLLGMKHLFGNANQMDNMVFGTLCHWALEQYGKNFVGDHYNVNEVKEFIISKLQQKITEKYGFKPALAIQLQFENAKRRLEKAAVVEVESRIDGWEIVECEYNAEALIDDILVSGKIDRIEYNPKIKKWRIIDFKTSAKVEAPDKAHFGKEAIESDSKLLSFNVRENKPPQLWKNLQLPLYIKLLDCNNSLTSTDGTIFDSSLMNFELGYFNLPDAVSETGLSFWKGYTPAITESAFNCAREVIRRIKERDFWPPADKIDFDNFEELYTEGIFENINSELMIPGGENE